MQLAAHFSFCWNRWQRGPNLQSVGGTVTCWSVWISKIQISESTTATSMQYKVNCVPSLQTILLGRGCRFDLHSICAVFKSPQRDKGSFSWLDWLEWTIQMNVTDSTHAFCSTFIYMEVSLCSLLCWQLLKMYLFIIIFICLMFFFISFPDFQRGVCSLHKLK